MSSAPSYTLPSPAELENLGVLFIGFVITTVFYGLTFFQSYIYYSRYPKDHQWIRILVATVCILDTATSALVSEVLYYYLIVLFNVNLDVLYATTTFCVQYMFSVLLTFIPRLYFAHRAFQVTGGSRVVIVVLIFLSFVALVFGLTATGQMLAQRRLSAFGTLPMEVTVATSQVTGVMADMIIFATTCYSLRRARYPEMVVPNGFLPTVVTVLVCRGLAFIVIQIAYFCVFIAAPSRQLWIPLQMTASKFYVNSLLGYLNSRDVKHGRGVNEEAPLTDHRGSPNGQSANSVRINVGNVKARTQSINLTTRPTDTESEGTGLESRKTYQDEHGNEYAQVSTGSSQSRTDSEPNKEGLSEQV